MKDGQGLLRRLVARASKGNVEVEHLLALAVAGDPAIIPSLDELKLTHHWPEMGRIPDSTDRLVPLGRWCYYVCEYLRLGCGRMVELALDEGENALDRQDGLPIGVFALGVLEEIRTAESFRAVLYIAMASTDDLERALRCARVMNHLTIVKPPAEPWPEDRAAAREFLHGLLERDMEAVHRASVYYALRGVGDSGSITLLNRLPALPDPWSMTRAEVIRSIRKRLAAH